VEEKKEEEEEKEKEKEEKEKETKVRSQGNTEEKFKGNLNNKRILLTYCF
jgi:hypothetical protein